MFSDGSINHPPSAQFHKKEFFKLLSVGIPTQDSSLESKPSINKKIKIIHCPSKSLAKGSHLFAEIIQSEVKYDIEYVTASGIPNQEVINLISTADIALDEFYSDTPLAVFASECASQKIPVVVGSYYKNEIKNDYDEQKLPPSAFVHPTEIEKTIEELIINQEKRKKLGEEAFNFVQNNWSPSSVAKRYIKLINKDYPKEWKYNPKNNKYIYGCGLSRDQLLKNLKKFSKGKKGSNVFFLEDKPLINDEYFKIINEKK